MTSSERQLPLLGQHPRKKRPRKPISEQNKPGRYDPRNTLNDLTGRDWLLLTSSYWVTDPTADDKIAYAHPAPFMIRDIQKLVSLFTKEQMTVLDPFAGSGTTLIAANRINRRAIGIDINPEYQALARRRLASANLHDFLYHVGDANKVLPTLRPVDYIVTSPPYHNILRNNAKGTRNDNGKSYRMGAREGVKYYTDHQNDLGNMPTYPEFLFSFTEMMAKAVRVLVPGKYCTVMISDFTVDKAEVSVQGDIVDLMEHVGFTYCGTTVLLQPVKPLYPFGYPYAYKINHHHQNMITFQKPKTTGPSQVS